MEVTTDFSRRIGVPWLEESFLVKGQYLGTDRGKVKELLREFNSLRFRSTTADRLICVCKYSLSNESKKSASSGLPRRSSADICKCSVNVHYLASDYGKSLENCHRRRSFLLDVLGKIPKKSLKAGWYVTKAIPEHRGHMPVNPPLELVQAEALEAAETVRNLYIRSSRDGRVKLGKLLADFANELERSENKEQNSRACGNEAIEPVQRMHGKRRGSTGKAG
ncbi:hypothetical protein NDN08_001831 [Rhodosorus marinus]|uniref:Uncharacterized protein n=1 Tax=Rhodosorus marinus TaxID=101924 RepID=A0AAV8US31_9RHOD|nr:hypothetical protein NDN08_001831 [Rhodosorus marinus]